MNEHLPKPEPVDEAAESSLKEKLILDLANSETLQDLARIKKLSLNLDLGTNYPAEVHRAIIKRFEELLMVEVKKLPTNQE